MRILIHTDEYYPTAQACSYRMRTMADAFIDQGDEVVVIASSTNKGNGKIESRREKILYSPAIRMKKKTTVMRMLNNFSFGFTSIFTSLKAGKIDVVITASASESGCTPSAASRRGSCTASSGAGWRPRARRRRSRSTQASA